MGTNMYPSSSLLGQNKDVSIAALPFSVGALLGDTDSYGIILIRSSSRRYHVSSLAIHAFLKMTVQYKVDAIPPTAEAPRPESETDVPVYNSLDVFSSSKPIFNSLDARQLQARLPVALSSQDLLDTPPQTGLVTPKFGTVVASSLELMISGSGLFSVRSAAFLQLGSTLLSIKAGLPPHSLFFFDHSPDRSLCSPPPPLPLPLLCLQPSSWSSEEAEPNTCLAHSFTTFTKSVTVFWAFGRSDWVEHVRHPGSGEVIVDELRWYYGKLPAVVELCSQAGAQVGKEYWGLMREDVSLPDLEEVKCVSLIELAKPKYGFYKLR
ncbi:APO protein 3 [Nymphaea thermarum]|nr:APO protein 3 [Nymphaea thermarum]